MFEGGDAVNLVVGGSAGDLTWGRASPGGDKRWPSSSAGLEPGGPRRAQAQHLLQFVHAGPPHAGKVTESSPDVFYLQQHIRDPDLLRAVLATLKRFMQEY